MAEPPRILALFGARVLFGQERANIEALAALRDEGCEVLCVIRPEEWPELLAIRKALETRALAWVTAPYIDYPVRGWIIHALIRNPGAYLKGNATLKRVARDFAPTHIHAFNPIHVAAFFGALRILPTPLVYRAGEKPIRHNAFWRAIWRFIVKRAAAFVADSEFIKAELISTGVDPGRVTVIHAPPPRRMNPPPLTIPERLDRPDVVRFVYVGQLTARKGVDRLVEAFGQVARSAPGAALLIAGRISDWSGDDWARALRDHARADPILAGRVEFLGVVEDAPELIRRCHVHVAPSVTEEGYGLVVVEAKSVGRPSIIFPSGGMAELVQDGVDGTVAPDKTVAGLARAMLAYAADPDLTARQGEAALASLDRLDLESFSSRWRAVYDLASA